MNPYRMRASPSGAPVGPVIVEAENVSIGDTQSPIVSFPMPENTYANVQYEGSVYAADDNWGASAGGGAFRRLTGSLDNVNNPAGPWFSAFSDGILTIELTVSGTSIVLLGRRESSPSVPALFSGTLFIFLRPIPP